MKASVYRTEGTRQLAESEADFSHLSDQTIDVIPILSAEQLEACWLEGLKVLAPDDSVWRASTYCGGPGFWQSHVHGLWWQQLWERYGNTLRILGPSLRFRQG